MAANFGQGGWCTVVGGEFEGLVQPCSLIVSVAGASFMNTELTHIYLGTNRGSPLRRAIASRGIGLCPLAKRWGDFANRLAQSVGRPQCYILGLSPCC
jgi:hypothetical protein